MPEIKRTNLAERIAREYFSYALNEGDNFIDLPTRRQEGEIVATGDIHSMVYPFFCINNLLGLGALEEAEVLATSFANEQMANLRQNEGTLVNVHTAKLLHSPSVSAYEIRLKNTKHCVYIDTNMGVFPFIGVDLEGICAIESASTGKCLYVNPQIFNEELTRPLLNFQGNKTSREFVDLYRKLLVASFGEINVDAIRPWLREGRLTKF